MPRGVSHTPAGPQNSGAPSVCPSAHHVCLSLPLAMTFLAPSSLPSVTWPPLTLEEPDVALGVLEGCVHRAGQPLPVPRGQCRVAGLQLAPAQPPHKACLEEEELAADGGGRVKGDLAGIRWGIRLG